MVEKYQQNIIFQNQIQELKVDLLSYQEKLENSKPVVFYQIQVHLGKRSWQLEKRYNQFSQLDYDLRNKHPNIPKLPGKTFFKLKASEDIDKRRQDLHIYLQDLVNRQDMRTNLIFRQFLELDNQIPDSVIYGINKICELNDLNLGGRDIVMGGELIGNKNYKILFVAMSDMNITSRLDSYLTNIQLPWEKSSQDNDKFATVGALSAYRVGIENENWEFIRMWTKTFASQTNTLYWYEEKEMLYIGLDSGKIYVLNVPQQYNYMRFQEMHQLNTHSKRVMGMAINKKLNHLISISDDGKLKLTDLINYEQKLESNPSKSSLKSMIYEEQRDILIIGDSDGCIHVYNTQQFPIEYQSTIQIQSKSTIRDMCLSQGSFYLMAGSIDGSISVLELNKPGKERFIKQIANFQGMPGCRVMVWKDQNREIITGNQSGIITIWSAKEGIPLFVQQAHTGAITKFIWDGQKQQIISCGKDKRIKVWQLPDRWMDEQKIIEQVKQEEKEEKQDKEQDNNEQIIYQQNDEEQIIDLQNENFIQQQVIVKQQVERHVIEDEEEDDLKGWAK